MNVFLAWYVRVSAVLATLAGIVLLIVDSPLAMDVPFALNHKIAEAAPLLLVGVGYIGWLLVDRPALIDLLKQSSIAAAFILWGVDLLLPSGQWSTFLGAVVIAIYVFDLAWLMDGHVRQNLSRRLVERNDRDDVRKCVETCWCGAICIEREELGTPARSCGVVNQAASK